MYAQRTTERVVQRSLENRVRLYTVKRIEMRISFTKSHLEFDPFLINGDALEVVDSVKLLGLNISSEIRRPLRDYYTEESNVHHLPRC